MFTDPLTVSYDGNSLSLPRVSLRGRESLYRTADGEFEVSISNSPNRRSGQSFGQLMLTHTVPDPTPADVFNTFRVVRNSVGITYGFDALTRAQIAVDAPLLRTAVLALGSAAFMSRVVAGEI